MEQFMYDSIRSSVSMAKSPVSWASTRAVLLFPAPINPVSKILLFIFKRICAYSLASQALSLSGQKKESPSSASLIGMVGCIP